MEETEVVAKERVGLVLQVDHHQIEVAIVIRVTGHDAHARLGRTVLVQGAAAQQGLVAEPPAVHVEPELVHHRVVGHEDVDEAVLVEVAADDAEPVAERAVDAGLTGHLAEAACPLVAE